MWRKMVEGFAIGSVPWFVVILGGLAGVLVDADHLAENDKEGGKPSIGRKAHVPLFFISSIVLGCTFAYIRRLYTTEVLRR